MHLDSRKDSNKAELENVRISKNPTKVATANGDVLTKEEATENVRDLDLFVTVMICSSFEFLMAYASIADRKLKAANSNPEVPERKVQRGSGSSDELMVDSAAPSWGQNIQKMMICMMGKIDGTADEIMEVKTLATNARSEAAEASTAVKILRVEVDTIKKNINELQGRRPGKSEPDDEKTQNYHFWEIR